SEQKPSRACSTARVTSSASLSLGAIPTAGRQGASCGAAFSRSSVVTYSAVARVSRSASTGPPRARRWVYNADPGRPPQRWHLGPPGASNTQTPWNRSSRMIRFRLSVLVVAAVVAAVVLAVPAGGGAANVNVSQRHLNESEEAIAVNPTNPNNIVIFTNVGHAEAGLPAG